MEHFVRSVEQSLASENWYGALALALMLPDMCAYTEKNADVNWRDYAAWFDKWVGNNYRMNRRFISEEHANDPDGFISKAAANGTLQEAMMRRESVYREVIFLSGKDCYCLRCVFAHKASDDIASQRMRDTIDKFIFVYPDGPISMHNNYITDGATRKLQLQVDEFCMDLCGGVRRWQQDANERNTNLDFSRLLNIRPSSVGF